MAYGSVDTSDAADAGLFALPALLITFRETLEAAIIVSVLLGLLVKLNLPHLRRYVWLGVLSGSGLCIAGGVIVLVLVNVLKTTLLDDRGTVLLEGSMSIIAAVLIAVVAMSIGNVMAIHAKWESELTRAIDAKTEGEAASEAISAKAIFFLSFTAVVREGIETIVFFVGIGAAYPPESLPIPAVVGAVLGVICGLALYKFGGRLTIVWFFRVTMVLLVFIGAGVFSNGVRSLQQAGSFGEWEVEENRPPLNVIVWDITECCGLDVSEAWILLHILFGYQPAPTGLNIMVYILFHVVVWTIIAVRYKLQRMRDEGKETFVDRIKARFRRNPGTDIEPRPNQVADSKL